MRGYIAERLARCEHARIVDVGMSVADPVRVGVVGASRSCVTSVTRMLADLDIPAVERAGGAVTVGVISSADAATPVGAQLLIATHADLAEPTEADRGPWGAAVAGARAESARRGVPVLPVVIPMALAQLGTTDLLDDDRHHLGEFGWRCARGALRRQPSLDAAGLTAMLRSLSGSAAIAAALRPRLAGIDYQRARDAMRSVRAVGLADPSARDEAERISQELLGAVADCAAQLVGSSSRAGPWHRDLLDAFAVMERACVSREHGQLGVGP